MSGHSKWHNIKRKKSANDEQKSKIFSKISRFITVAARQGGKDTESNPSLRLAIQKAKEARMPKDNIDKAIKKGTGEGLASSFVEITYEGFGPQGGALIVECLTDNINRTVSEIRSIFNRSGGSLGAKGCTSYIFNQENKIAMFFVEIKGEKESEQIDNLIEFLEDHEDVQDVYHNYKFTEGN